MCTLVRKKKLKLFLFLPQPFAPEHWELLQHGGNYPGEWHCHLTHFRPMYTHYCTRVHVCVRVVSWHSQLCSDLTRSIFLSAYGEKETSLLHSIPPALLSLHPSCYVRALLHKTSTSARGTIIKTCQSCQVMITELLSEEETEVSRE